MKTGARPHAAQRLIALPRVRAGASSPGRRVGVQPEPHGTKVRNLLGGFGSWRLIIGAAVLLLAILLWSSWFTVQPEETGVVQRFGAVVRTVGPGLHFKLPYGVETVRLVPTARVLKEEFGFRTVVPCGAKVACRHISGLSASIRCRQRTGPLAQRARTLANMAREGA